MNKEKWEDERHPLNNEKFKKGLGQDLEEKLSKKYKPSARIDAIFRGKDITFFTNEHGEAITLFIGTRNEDGNIKGDRYERRIKEREGEKITQSHWDNKGKVRGTIRK